MPELAQACAIERAATQLRDWPPTNPWELPTTPCTECSTDHYKIELHYFNKWAEENSSPAAHQTLETELADMCSYALATDLRFVGEYCNAATDHPTQTGVMLSAVGTELPPNLKWQIALEQTHRGIATQKRGAASTSRAYVPGRWEAQLQEQCTYAKAHGIEGISAYCHLF
tara:strand:+ start:560 stop:1072 length:513 start_codon:yes stop_codon:yes gene_type:complete